MKKITSTALVWLLFALSSYATDYYVHHKNGNDANDGTEATPLLTIAKAATKAIAAGDKIIVAAGTYAEASFMLSPGVSLQGAGIDQTLITCSACGTTSEKAVINLVSSSLTAGNQSLSGFTLDGLDKKSFMGIRIENRSKITVFDVKVKDFYQHGIWLEATSGQIIQDIDIHHFQVWESSREIKKVGDSTKPVGDPKRYGYQAFGNINLKGGFNNLTIHDGEIRHELMEPIEANSTEILSSRPSGYAIKFEPVASGNVTATDFITNTQIYRIKEYGKPHSSWRTDFPDIGIEFFHVGGAGVQIYDCEFTSQVSLEYDFTKPEVPYSFWVRDNHFKVRYGQSVELAVSKAVIENNIFDYRTNANPWNVIGEYNPKTKGAGNIHVRRNYFLLGASSPAIWGLKNASSGIYFYNNTLTGTGNPTMFVMWRPHSNTTSTSNTVSTDIQILNNAFDLGGAIKLFEYQTTDGITVGQPSKVVLRNNHHSKPLTDLPTGATTDSNREVVPALLRTGTLPLPYLSTAANSTLIDGGTTSLPAAPIVATPIAAAYSGAAPDIGAYEFTSTTNIPLIALKFNEGTGAAINNTGSLTASFNRTTPVPAWSDQVPAGGGASSLDFGATTGNYAVESSGPIAGLGNLPAFTITGWLNCRSSTAGGGGNRVVSWINNGGAGVDLVYHSNGSLQMSVDEWPDGKPTSSSAGKVTTNATVEASNWVFFAASYRYNASANTGEIKFYFGDAATDATLDVTRPYNRGNVDPASAPLAVGHFNNVTRSGATDRMFRGLIDGIQIFGSALSAQDIVAIQRNITTQRSSTFYRAININGSTTTIDGNQWEAGTATDFSTSGTAFNSPGVALSPPTDANRAAMIRSSVYSTTAQATMSNVPPGTYDVYVYVWEDNASQTYSLSLEGQVVQTNYVSGSAGTWRKLGPYRKTIADGAINLATSGGDANLSGIEVWRVASGSGINARLGVAKVKEVTDETRIYPNPSQGTATLLFWADREQTVQIRVNNAMAQPVLSTSHQAATGMNYVRLGLDGAAEGFYTVTLLKDNQRIVRKLMLLRE